MSNVLKALMRGGAVAPLYVDDVFSAYTYTGNGSTQTITNGIDLAGEGGMVWIKKRSATGDNLISDTTRGLTTNSLSSSLATNSAGSANATAQYPYEVSAFNSDGFSVGSSYSTNAATYVSWTFRNAPNFYYHDVVTKSAGSNATYNFSMHTAGLGMVRVKRTDAAGSWYVWHRSLTAGKLLIGETTAAEATLGHITVSGTTVTLVNGVIADGTYLVEAWAHDTSAEGMIQCGSFTTNASGNATVNLGWEPQFVIGKNATGAANNWFALDTMRGLTNNALNVAQATLFPNLANAESSNRYISIGATGMSIGGWTASATIPYLAIRRPNKPPTLGTQVYKAAAWTGNSTARSITGIGFPVDVAFIRDKSATTGYGFVVQDRLRGATNEVWTWDTGAEVTGLSDCLTSFGMDGVSLGADTANHGYNKSSNPEIGEFFRCAAGVMDRICTTGTGANKTEAHNLGAAPQLWLHKGRSGATEWVWGSSLLANTQKIVMPSPNGVVTDATAWNSTYPTASVISFGTAAAVNTNAATYVTYLWATLAGVSKVFTYTGDGGSGKVIDCGFAAGARFVMIIRTTASTAQDIFIWDSVRGIVAGNDPHLSLNTTAAEVTTDDSIDPDTSGFAVNQVAATNINVNGAVYIGLAYA